MSRFVIIVAGGTGTRMRTNTAKQFLMIEGLPILWRTLRRFGEAVPDAPITLVLHESLFDEFRILESEHGPSGATHLIKGGAERFHSVLAGLTSLPDEGLVAIHDAVRPFPSIKLIRTAFDTAATHGSAIPTIPLKDSIRKISYSKDSDSVSDSVSVNRSDFLSVQTPQCFDLSLLKPAFASPYSPTFTDDASVFEASGHPITLCQGDPVNIKLTTPEDLIIARALFGE
ncbi:MAG: 2-C-methyl-D-erythritol 4-phosphate cytidylyltransferase [Bacteroidetes bacterium]|nr:MAG: 2-C-methyl-D-erythritol 4-phosphate cytidylyltransferase [Bacteroidota bacterium]